MKKIEDFINKSIESYAKGLNFQKLIKKNKSEEAYFGEDNPLKNRLIANITHMRMLANDAKAKNPSATPKILLHITQPAIDELKLTIKEEFNVEKVVVGWMNDMNAACYTQCWNGDIMGEKGKKIRFNLDDIVESKNGFKYKKSDGIAYVLLLGYSIFIDDRIFSVEEAAAVLVHELGHGMQHIVNSINATAGTDYYRALLFGQGSVLGPKNNAWTALLASFRKADDDPKSLDEIGGKILDNMNPDDPNTMNTKFSSATDEQITGLNNDNSWDTDVTAEYKAEQDRKPGFFSKLVGSIASILGSVVDILVGIFIIPIVLAEKSWIKNKEINKFKVFEETADNFTFIYGLGAYQASALKKMFDICDNISGENDTFSFITKVPLLNLHKSISQIEDLYVNTMAGYPYKYERALNIWKAGQFELKNNSKDLTKDEIDQIKKQMDDIEKIYNEYIDSMDKNKTRLFKKIANVSRESIEKAAKKNTLVDTQVLIPIQKRSDPNFDPKSDD